MRWIRPIDPRLCPLCNKKMDFLYTDETGVMCRTCYKARLKVSDALRRIAEKEEAARNTK